jgi:apolipoprotein N-acyltransferase
MIFWAGNLYWLSWVTPYGVGYIAAVFYLSLYWPLAALLLRPAVRRGWPIWAVLPVYWVALEFARAYVLSGFPWFYLAHTQYARTWLIQIVDATGVYGVSFFVAMVNGLVVDAAMRHVASRPGGGGLRRLAIGTGVTLAALAGLVGYGWFRIAQAPRFTSPGPVVGVVQRAHPVSLTIRTDSLALLADHFHATRLTMIPEPNSPVRPDLVLWPETVIPRGLNREYFDFASYRLPGEVLDDYARRFLAPEDRGRERAWRRVTEGQLGRAQRAATISYLARRVGATLLIGGGSVVRNDRPEGPDDHWLLYNSALMFPPTRMEPDDPAPVAAGLELAPEPPDANGLPVMSYHKMHLVPFSEYVPFKRTVPWLHRVLRWFVPEVMEQLEPGRREVRFPVPYRREGQEEGEAERICRVAAPICYEGTFARVCRRLVMSDGSKVADLIASLSNDGWFTRPSGERAIQGGVADPNRWVGSSEQIQHFTHYVFRAIETRTPVVRAVNTGVSGSIDSCGRIEAMIERDGRLTMIDGTLLLSGERRIDANQPPTHYGPRVLVDSRVTLYSAAGDVFAATTTVIAVGLVGVSLLPGRRHGREGRTRGPRNV